MIKLIYLILSLVYLNATSYVLAQMIKPLQTNFPVLLIAIFTVALPVAFFWRPILFNKNGNSKILLDEL